MISRKLAYADDLALLHSFRNLKDLKGTASQEISSFSMYLQTWSRLKLSHTKMVTTVSTDEGKDSSNPAQSGIRISNCFGSKGFNWRFKMRMIQNNLDYTIFLTRKLFEIRLTI